MFHRILFRMIGGLHLPCRLRMLIVLFMSATLGCGEKGQAQPGTAASPKKAVPERRLSLPEYYGLYAVDGRKTAELKSGAELLHLSKNAEFLLFDKDADSYSRPNTWQLRYCFFDFEDEDWTRSKLVVECRTKPVTGQPDMLRIVPRRSLEPGYYVLEARSKVDELMAFLGSSDELEIPLLFEADRLKKRFGKGAREAVALRHWADALAYTTVGLSVFPNNEGLIAMRGSIPGRDTPVESPSDRAWFLIGQYKFSEAVFPATTAINLDPEFPGRYLSRAYGYRALGEYDRAVKDTTDGIEHGWKDYDYSSHYYIRGVAYYLLGDMDRAIGDLSISIQTNPTAMAFSFRGYIHAIEYRYDEAFRDLNEAIKMEPEVYSWYSNRGYAYRHKGDYGRAMQDFEKAAQLDPQARSPFLGRVPILISRGEVDAALKAAEDGMLLLRTFFSSGEIPKPELAYALACRAEALWALGREDKARAAIDEAQSLHPQGQDVQRVSRTVK